MKNQCQARSKRTGKQCGRAASPGKRVCYYHGGATPKGGGGPVGNTKALQHGLYSDVLFGDEKELYEILRVKPANLDDHIALLEVKIHRFVDKTNVDFNFDDWQNDVHQTFERVMEQDGKQTPVRVERIVKKPQGPAMLCTMLDMLLRMYVKRHQMQLEKPQEEGGEVIPISLPPNASVRFHY